MNVKKTVGTRLWIVVMLCVLAALLNSAVAIAASNINTTGWVHAQGNAIVGGDLTVDGAIDFTAADPTTFGGNVSVGGYVLLANGAAATPSLTFTNDRNTGLYWGGGDNIYVSAAGGLKWGIDSNKISSANSGAQFLNALSTYTVPAFSPGNSDTDSGLGSGAANSLSLITGGKEQGRFNATSFIVNSTAAANVPLVVKGAASQTGNLQEWQNSSGTVKVVVDETGKVGIGTTTPGAKLEVYGPTDGSGAVGIIINHTGHGDNNARLDILSGATTGRSEIFMGDIDDNDIGAILYHQLTIIWSSRRTLPCA
jgi:hypothetical protein